MTDGHGGEDRGGGHRSQTSFSRLARYRRGWRERIHTETRSNGDDRRLPVERVGPAYGRPPDRASPGDHKPRGFRVRACDRWDSLDPQPRERAAHSRSPRPTIDSVLPPLLRFSCESVISAPWWPARKAGRCDQSSALTARLRRGVKPRPTALSSPPSNHGRRGGRFHASRRVDVTAPSVIGPVF